jgi:hypothetical protein
LTDHHLFFALDGTVSCNAEQKLQSKHQQMLAPAVHARLDEARLEFTPRAGQKPNKSFRKTKTESSPAVHFHIRPSTHSIYSTYLILAALKKGSTKEQSF